MSPLRRAWAPFSRLTAKYWAWLVVKALIVAWMVFYALLTPPATVAALGALVWVWTSVAAAGALTSIVGMIITVQPSARSKKLGTTVELAGIIVAASGPFVHAATLGWIIVLSIGGTENAGRTGPLFQSLIILATLIARGIEVSPRFERLRGKI